MNRNRLKQYAPQARRDFIAAVTDRAAHYGMTKEKIDPITEQGEVALIKGTPFPRSVAAKRKRLEERINRQGFEQVMEAMAYTWFNRLVAIRYMELHGYLDHGYRVLSHPEGKTTPEIIEHAEHVDIPGLDTPKVIELKLDGTKEAELYRMLLVAQCNALHSAMPFLFERINDETELLLPDNLLHSDSLIRKLVNAIDEEDWQEVEIIGWLYQFYISEKKDEVIGKVVKSEDIPAATQLFTPNWIVKYLVQNSLGRQWMATYPDSRLKEQMEFYIEPAEQTPEVQVQLNEITPDSLNPEELTLLDPACGSGHILVEAYDLLKAIYLERGYRARDIPGLILEKNLYGLEIDDRAAQLSAFALMMKARADNRRIFANGVQPHVLAIQESKGLDAKGITEALNTPLEHGEKQGQQGDIAQADVAHLIELFEHGKTLGSLICVPRTLAEKLPAIAQRVKDVLAYGDMLEQGVTKTISPIVEQARILASKYEVVLTNPPYMGGKFFCSSLRDFVKRNYKYGKTELYGAFIIRNMDFCASHGFVGMITIPNWMFLSSFESLRDNLLTSYAIDSLVHNGRGVWGSDFGSCSFVLRNSHLPTYQGSYRRLFEIQGSVASVEELRLRFFRSCTHIACSEDFEHIPGHPIAYWVSDPTLNSFRHGKPFHHLATPRAGMISGNNDKFVRLWHEVDFRKIGFGYQSRTEAQNSRRKWFPYLKGGPFRKWYGNYEYVVDWEGDGYRLRTTTDSNGKIPAHAFNEQYIFKPNVNWSAVTVSAFSVRITEKGCLFDAGGSAAFPTQENLLLLAAFLNSKVAAYLLSALNPTVNYQAWNIGALPILPELEAHHSEIDEIVIQCKQLADKDWNSNEMAWDFLVCPLLEDSMRNDKLESSLAIWSIERDQWCQRMVELEKKSNGIFISVYALQDALSPDITQEEVTMGRLDQEEDIKRLISYAIGCMMGRYSLDKPGLIYAHSGNQGFDSSQYQTFPADGDGIIPITDDDWFPDDTANRVEAFIATAWPKEHLEENLKFIAESLGPNRNEQPRETIRRYLATGFFKHHLSMYKRRPIYWLFSSGKQRAFQCLIYLHRYNEGTLSRMRTEYVIPLQGKMASRIGQLDDDIAAATSTSHRKSLEKERDRLLKQQAELQTFDEQLRHYADRRIRLDLDDGVKVNYGKFGDLLAEVKAVTGGTDGP